jgi:pyrroline-5-carboxylate reductase
MRAVKLAFVGGGNMARSLIGGLVASGVTPHSITVAEPDRSRREALRRGFDVRVTDDNAAAVEQADVVILATKPQALMGAIRSAGPAREGALYLSVAAGIRVDDIRDWLGGDVAIVRAMPNTPALMGCGAAALFANPAAEDEQRELAETIMRSVGAVVWVPREDDLDPVTALSGSGPAYFFLLIETMIKTGVELGLEPAAATLLAEETALGAARMALESEEDVAELRRRVTSPGGTTEAGLQAMEAAGVPAGIAAGIRAASARAAALARDFGRDEE